MQKVDTFFQKQSLKNYKNILKQFKKISIFFSAFKIGFWALLFTELLLIVSFHSSLVISIIIGGIFLTIFTYLVLIFYFQTKKPELFHLLKDSFKNSCKHALVMPPKTAQYHLSIVNAYLKLISQLNDSEYKFYSPPKFIFFTKSLMKKISYCLHKSDVFFMKELLLMSAINEHFEQIKITPTDLEIHASLANTYTVLSKLYLEQIKKNTIKYFKKNYINNLKIKFNSCSQKAIEEFKILSDYAPNDPWVAAQLAQSYRNLQMPEEEAKTLQVLSQLSPNDQEVIFRLGILYFELGENSKGLKIYEQLKNENFKKADDLISFYSSNFDNITE